MDWWSCLALMRESRSVDRQYVCFAFSCGIEAVLADVALKGLCWALIAPALSSSSLRWPFERRGASLEREAQGVIGSRGREAMKSVGDGDGCEVALYDIHCRSRFREKTALKVSSFTGRLWAL